MDTFQPLADTLFVRLAWTSAQATLLIGALWLLGRWLPRLSPAIRCMLWWILSVQLVVGTPLAMPLLPSASSSDPAMATRHRVASIPASVEATPPAELVAASAPPSSAMTITQTSPPASVPPHPLPWRSFVMALWLVGLCAQWLLVARQWHKTRRVLRESTPLHDRALQAQCALRARIQGLRHCPSLRVSPA